MLAILFATLLAAIPARADGTLLHKFESLPADAEVHVVSIYEPRFRGVEEDEITDWRELIKQLRADSGPGAHIRKRLRKEADEVLTEGAEKGTIDGVHPTAVPKLVRMVLSTGLGRAMWFKSFYDETAFAGIELPKAVKELIALGDKRTIYQNELLNRELLAAAFPTCIAPRSADFHRVRVTVKAGKPVVLVLASAHQCRWEITVEKGAVLAGVGLLGGGAQELTGTDTAVVYVAGYLPSGEQLRNRASYSYKQEGKSYERMVADMKEITGRDFTRFQGYNKAPKEPIMVAPGAAK